MGNVWTERAIELAKICPRERFEPRALVALKNALTSGTKIALACSGGSDSLALLLLTWGHFPEIKDRLCVLHLNHALRGSDSDGDAKFVEEVANTLGADFVCEKVDWEKLSVPEGVGEDFLRKLRLEFYSRAMCSKGCEILLQGHQLSDVEELLIMRLTRGAGVGGLSAPRPVSPQSDGRIFVRPLLDIPKHEIESFLKKLEIPWREDSTNAERDYFRCRVRHDVMPSISDAAPFVNIARSRMLLEETDDFLEACAEEFLQSEKKITPDIPRALLRRVLIKIFSKKGAELRAKTLDALVSAICEKTQLKFAADKNFDVVWDGNELTISGKPTNTDNNLSNPADEISQEVVEITPELFEKIRAGEFSPDTTAFLAGTPEISVRRWEEGDAFRPLGSPGTKTLGNLFSDKKIPKERRHGIPVCVDAEGIAWVPGLPPAERLRVSCGMKALRLTCKRASLS